MRSTILQKLVVDNYIDYIKSKKILDAGCGEGNFEYLIKQKRISCEIIGIDSKEKSLREARKNLPSFKFLKASLLEKLPFKKQEFNTIVMFDVIEHLPKGSEKKALKQLNRVLKKGGYLIVSTMHSTHLNFLDPAWYFGHRHYSKDELSSLIVKAGFKVRKINLIGDFWWELDTILLYVSKYIFRKEYPNPLRKRFSPTDRFGKKGTRLCLVCQKLD